MKVLIIDDEKHVREVVRLYLAREGFDVYEAETGEQGLEMISCMPPDFIVLDIMLPGMDGWSVCKGIRRKVHVPIIMLSAKGDEVDKIMGLEMGADDYLTKPFSPGELVARIRAITRRLESSRPSAVPGGNTLNFQALTMDLDQHRAELKGADLQLTPKEFDLLWHMASHPSRAFTREGILEQVWGYDFMGDVRTVDAHIKRLRQKMDVSKEWRYIHTVWGVGYKFEESRI